jgi:ABC-2 type transport system ATP-binding protein
MIRIEGVTKKYPSGTCGVRDLSLAVSSGVLGLLGPNGAGKTTLMQMIATIMKPTTGKIFFQDHDVAKDPEFVRERLGYLPQDFGVYENLTATEFLTYFAALKGVHDRKKIVEMLELVNLHSVSKRMVGSFSGGMKQRLGIAQALINNPELLIVDEPTAGLDPEERVRFRNILSDIGDSRLVILSTHIVSDVESIATEIAILRNGTLASFGTPENLLRAASGKVWECVMPTTQFEGMRAHLKVSSAIRRPDGIHVRIVHPQAPAPQATLAEPNLEDSFVYCMNFSGAAA